MTQARTKKLTPPQLLALTQLAQTGETSAREQTLQALRLSNHVRTRIGCFEITPQGVEALRGQVPDVVVAQGERQCASIKEREGAEAQEEQELRRWLRAAYPLPQFTDLDALRLHQLRQRKSRTQQDAGSVGPARLPVIYQAAVRCAAAEGKEAPPPPGRMVAAVLQRHPGALLWLRMIMGPQEGEEGGVDAKA